MTADWVVIVNPSAGQGRGERFIPRIAQFLTGLNSTARMHVSTGPEDFRAAVAAERDRGAARVAIAGGDGTVHLAIQELAGSETALGIIPMGTGDDNARTLGIPLNDVEAALALVIDGSIRSVDMGQVESADRSAYFLGVLSTGFDSLVNERANTMTWPGGKARYLLAILAELRVFRPVPYRMHFDGRVAEGPAMLVAVGNGISYGGGMRVCPGADPADGLLDITWLGGVPTRTFLRVFPSVFTGRHVESPYVATGRAEHIQLRAPEQLAYADGERIGPLPISVRVVPGALRVVVPSTP